MISFSLQKSLHTADGEVQLNVSCAIKNGEFTSLYGPSGAGKTSILRMLAGLMKPEKGFIEINEEVWFDGDKGINVTPQHRRIGFVFQDYALFPNMTVRENIAFPLVKGQRKAIVEELLEFTGLSLLAGRKIETLSGGQQQRVALARAIAGKPQLLLLDEPLSAIDNTLREQLQETLLQLHKQYELTTIIVSHDISEIVKISDKIIRLENNSMQQYETPEAFLISLRHPSGLIGSVLSIEENESGNNIVLLVRSTVLKISSLDKSTNDLKKGQEVKVVYDKNTEPIINKL